MCSSSTSTSTFNQSSLESSSLSPSLPSRVELLEKGRLKGEGERLGKEGGGGGATISGLGGGALMVL